MKGRDLKAWASSHLPHPGNLWGMAWTHQYDASSGIDIAASTLGRSPMLAPISLNAGLHKSSEGTFICWTKRLHPFSPRSHPKVHSSEVQEKGVP